MKPKRMGHDKGVKALFLQHTTYLKKIHMSFHRFKYPKGAHSYRYFLQPMCTWTSNSLPPMHEQMNEFEGRKNMYECTPFRYVKLCFAQEAFLDSGGILKWKVRTKTYQSPRKTSWVFPLLGHTYFIIPHVMFHAKLHRIEKRLTFMYSIIIHVLNLFMHVLCATFLLFEDHML